MKSFDTEMGKAALAINLDAFPKKSVSERRAVLEQVGKQLLAGGTRANQDREPLIWADVEVPVP